MFQLLTCRLVDPLVEFHHFSVWVHLILSNHPEADRYLWIFSVCIAIANLQDKRSGTQIIASSDLRLWEELT